MTVVHIVLFQFKDSADPSQVKATCDAMLALEKSCVRPGTSQPYVKMTVGGKNNSKEDVARDFTHGFVMHFENKEDRDYYVEKDPAHLAFIREKTGIVNRVNVFDFEPGVL